MGKLKVIISYWKWMITGLVLFIQVQHTDTILSASCTTAMINKHWESIRCNLMLKFYPLKCQSYTGSLNTTSSVWYVQMYSTMYVYKNERFSILFEPFQWKVMTKWIIRKKYKSVMPMLARLIYLLILTVPFNLQ